MKKSAKEKPIWLTVRLTAPEKQKLNSLLPKAAYCQTTSELVRDMLFKRKLTVTTRNESLERTLLELGLLRNELNKIGVNINQITHYFHMQADPRERVFFVKELLPYFERTKAKINTLHSLVEGLKF